MFSHPRSRHLNRLALLESRDLVDRVYATLHRRNLNSAKASEIHAHLSQAKAYFSAGVDADEIVRPLLLYYGTLALARAILLILHPSLRDSGLSSSHGLQAIAWKEHLGGGGDWLAARIRITSGTYSQFAEITSNRKTVEVYQGSGEVLRVTASGTSAYPAEYEFTVADILRRLPDVTELYETVVEAPSLVWGCRFSDFGDQLEIAITSNRLGIPDVETAKRLLFLDETIEIKEVITNYMGWGATPELKTLLNAATADNLAPHFGNIIAAPANSYLVKPLDGDLRVSYPSLLFAAAYALGMLVRYFPAHWMRMLSGQKGDRLLPLIRATASAVAGFPNAVSDYL